MNSFDADRHQRLERRSATGGNACWQPLDKAVILLGEKRPSQGWDTPSRVWGGSGPMLRIYKRRRPVYGRRRL